MRVIPPLTITSAMLTSSTVAEPDSGAGEATWNSGTTYAAGDQAISTTTHRLYQSKAGGNLNHDPATDTTETYWLDIGPTNRWAMFDLLRNTGTTDASPLTVVITPGARVDAIAAVGLEADAISISMTSSGSPAYSYSEDLRTRDTIDWYGYFFDEFEQKSAVALFDLPPYTNGIITVTLTRSTGDCTCGGVVLGQSVDLGSTIHGAENDALNFSKVERDEFGTATLVQRRTIPKTNQQTRIAKLAVNKALKARQDLNAMPALWSGLDDSTSGYFEPLLILGIYKRFTIAMDEFNSALISLELEEV